MWMIRIHIPLVFLFKLFGYLFRKIHRNILEDGKTEVPAVEVPKKLTRRERWKRSDPRCRLRVVTRTDRYFRHELTKWLSVWNKMTLPDLRRLLARLLLKISYNNPVILDLFKRDTLGVSY